MERIVCQPHGAPAGGKHRCWVYYDPAQSEGNIIIFSLLRFEGQRADGTAMSFNTYNPADDSLNVAAVTPNLHFTAMAPVAELDNIGTDANLDSEDKKKMARTYNLMFAKTAANKGRVTGVELQS